MGADRFVVEVRRRHVRTAARVGPGGRAWSRTGGEEEEDGERRQSEGGGAWPPAHARRRLHFDARVMRGRVACHLADY